MRTMMPTLEDKIHRLNDLFLQYNSSVNEWDSDTFILGPGKITDRSKGSEGKKVNGVYNKSCIFLTDNNPVHSYTVHSGMKKAQLDV